MSPHNSSDPAPELPDSNARPQLFSTDDDPQPPPPLPRHHSATILRDREFRIRAETAGDVMLTFVEQLRLRNILRTLPAMSVEILVLMLEILDGAELRMDRVICKVSYGYLHDAMGCAQAEDKKIRAGRRRPDKSVGHISRAMKTLIAAGIVIVRERGVGDTPTTYELQIPKQPADLIRRGAMSGRPTCAGAQASLSPARIPNARPRKDMQRARERLAFPQRALGMRARERPSVDTIDNSAAATAAAAEAGENAEPLVARLRQIGFEPAEASAIAAHPSCTAAQIEVAVARRKAKGDRVRNPLGYIRDAIEKKYAPLMTVEQRRDAARPEHAQEDEARRRQQVASTSTADLRAMQFYAGMPQADREAAEELLIQFYEQRGMIAFVKTARQNRHQLAKFPTLCRNLYELLAGGEAQ